MNIDSYSYKQIISLFIAFHWLSTLKLNSFIATFLMLLFVTALPPATSVWAAEDSVTEDSMTVEWTAVSGTESYTVEVRPSTGYSLKEKIN